MSKLQGGCLLSDDKSLVLLMSGKDKHDGEEYRDSPEENFFWLFGSENDVHDLEGYCELAKVPLEFLDNKTFGPLIPTPDPRRVRICKICKYVGGRFKELGDWVFDLTNQLRPSPPEAWIASWQGRSIPFWGGGEFHRRATTLDSLKNDQEIDSADGQWVIAWDNDKLEIKKWQENEPGIFLIFPGQIESVSIDNSMSMIAVESPPGELTFFNTRHMPPCGPLIATACRKLENNRVLEHPVVYPPCCAEKFSLPDALTDVIKKLNQPDQTLDSFDEPALLIKCPHCKTSLKFNPFFIDIRRIDLD